MSNRINIKELIHILLLLIPSFPNGKFIHWMSIKGKHPYDACLWIILKHNRHLHVTTLTLKPFWAFSIYIRQIFITHFCPPENSDINISPILLISILSFGFSFSIFVCDTHIWAIYNHINVERFIGGNANVGFYCFRSICLTWTFLNIANYFIFCQLNMLIYWRL